MMAILIQYLSAKLGIVTGLTLPQNCRKHFSRRTTLLLWVAAEVSAIATDLAEFLGAALGFFLLFGPTMLAHGFSRTGTMLTAALLSSVLVFVILALDLAGHQWLERVIMVFVGVIGLCYGFEVFLVHPDWRLAAFHALVPTLATESSESFQRSIYIAVGMLGATVMPHVIYLHSALVQPRLKLLALEPKVAGQSRRSQYLKFELIDVFVAMNGAWLINSAMIVMAAVAFFSHSGTVVTDVEQAYRTLGPLLGPAAATVFCGGAALLGAFFFYRWGDGWAGDYRGVPGYQVPDLSAAADYDYSGDRDYCDWAGSAENFDPVAGGAEFCAAVCVDSAVVADEQAGCDAEFYEQHQDARCRVGFGGGDFGVECGFAGAVGVWRLGPSPSFYLKSSNNRV